MAQLIRIGIIGAGGVARSIHLPGFALCPDVEIAAVCDANRDAARSLGVAARFRAARRNCCFARLDAVVIATPNHLHREIALAAIAAGKHVLCEKPLALNAADAQRDGRGGRILRLVHMTAFTYRFTPALQYLKRLVESGELGRLRTVRAAYLMALSKHLLGWRSLRRLAGSGVLADIGSHLVHMTQFLAGDIRRSHRVAAPFPRGSGVGCRRLDLISRRILRRRLRHVRDLACLRRPRRGNFRRYFHRTVRRRRQRRVFAAGSVGAARGASGPRRPIRRAPCIGGRFLSEFLKMAGSPRDIHAARSPLGISLRSSLAICRERANAQVARADVYRWRKMPGRA